MDETDTAAAEAQSGENEAIQSWTCVRLYCFSSGEHILVSVRRVLREGSIEDRTASVVLIMSSAWRRFTQRRTTARRSTTVAVDLPLFARISLQLLVLDGVERLFGHDQAPSKCLPQQQVSGKLLFFATCASLPRRWIVHSLYFSTNFRSFGQRLKSQSSHPTNVVEIPRSS